MGRVLNSRAAAYQLVQECDVELLLPVKVNYLCLQHDQVCEKQRVGKVERAVSVQDRVADQQVFVAVTIEVTCCHGRILGPVETIRNLDFLRGRAGRVGGHIRVSPTSVWPPASHRLAERPHRSGTPRNKSFRVRDLEHQAVVEGGGSRVVGARRVRKLAGRVIPVQIGRFPGAQQLSPSGRLVDARACCVTGCRQKFDGNVWYDEAIALLLARVNKNEVRSAVPESGSTRIQMLSRNRRALCWLPG